MREYSVKPHTNIDVEVTSTTAQQIDLNSYDFLLICSSGGKDSTAAMLWLIEAGAPLEKIEIHHQRVDGPDSKLMDWPVSTDYVNKLGAAFGIPVLHSWREGGMERELTRSNARTAPVTWQTIDGGLRTAGGDKGKESTRRMFPQVSADLKVRWCSAYQKIDVFARILTNDERFHNKKILVITGERAEESTSRANCLEFEPHRSDLRHGIKVQRHIDHIRPIHKWDEAKVWEIIKRHRVRPHPAYWLHFSRASCRSCIFNGPNEWATLRTHMPGAFYPIAKYEEEFDVTIHRSRDVNEQADLGVPHPCSLEHLLLAESTEYYEEIIVENEWILPPGAFKRGSGPT